MNYSDAITQLRENARLQTEAVNHLIKAGEQMATAIGELQEKIETLSKSKDAQP